MKLGVSLAVIFRLTIQEIPSCDACMHAPAICSVVAALYTMMHLHALWQAKRVLIRKDCCSDTYYEECTSK